MRLRNGAHWSHEKLAVLGECRYLGQEAAVTEGSMEGDSWDFGDPFSCMLVWPHRFVHFVKKVEICIFSLFIVAYTLY